MRTKHAANTKWFLSVGGYSHQGLIRENNEDSILILQENEGKGKARLLCAVADGMGGQDYGEEASAAAVEILRQRFDQLKHTKKSAVINGEWLKETAVLANQHVIREMNRLQPKEGMGTTLVAAIFAESYVYVANVGDSRAYLLRNNHLQAITRDHSLVAVMVEKGLITAEEVYTHARRGELTRFLGQNNEVAADLIELDYQPGDRFLLCSDGLWEMVRDDEIEPILLQNPMPQEACRKLIEAANNHGGADNVSVIVVNVLDKDMLNTLNVPTAPIGPTLTYADEKTKLLSSRTPPGGAKKSKRTIGILAAIAAMILCIGVLASWHQFAQREKTTPAVNSSKNIQMDRKSNTTNPQKKITPSGLGQHPNSDNGSNRNQNNDTVANTQNSVGNIENREVNDDASSLGTTATNKGTQPLLSEPDSAVIQPDEVTIQDVGQNTPSAENEGSTFTDKSGDI